MSRPRRTNGDIHPLNEHMERGNYFCLSVRTMSHCESIVFVFDRRLYEWDSFEAKLETLRCLM